MMLLAALILLQADPAETFRKMCQAVDEAKSIRVEASADITLGDKSGSLASRVWVKGDLARIEFTTARGGETSDLKLFIDHALCVEIDGGKRLDPEDVHLNTSRRLQAALSRTGVAGLSFLAGAAKYGKKTRNDLPELAGLECSAHAAAGEEAVGGRKAWKISYKAALKDSGLDPLAITVWIDQERHVPLKRSVSAAERGRAVTIVETATRFDLNGEMNDAELKERP